MGLRERYRRHGPEGLGDAELLALVLGTGCPGRNALRIATDLLEQFGGLGGLAHTPVSALTRSLGLGPARAIRIHAACQIANRLVRDRPLPDRIHNAQEAAAHFLARMGNLQQEELHAMFLDRRHRLLEYRVITRGNDCNTIVDPRQVMRVALLVGATALMVAHNHPSGDPLPSSADVEVTTRLVKAGHVLGVAVLDHLVVAGSRYRSFLEEGLLAAPPPYCTPVAAEPG